MIKLRAPAGRTVSLEGRPVEPAADGSYMAHPRDVDALRSHGFEDWRDHPGEAGDVETMTHPQLVEAIVAKTRAEAEKTDPERLRSALRGPGADLRTPTDEEIAEAEKGVNANAMTPERVAAMNRPELFAYLKAMHVSAPPPIANERLREIALDTLRKMAA